MMKGEQILESHSKIASTSVREISQNGIKLEFNHQVQLTGKFEAQGPGTTTIWLKNDGTSEWEDKSIATTKEGDFVAMWGKGIGRPAGLTAQAWEGEVHFMTQSSKLSGLNSAKVWAEGTADQAKSESHGKFYQEK